MIKDFRETLNERLKNPEFKAEYDLLYFEDKVITAIIEARKRKNITQKQIAEKAGMTQGDISKIEKGNVNPSLKILQRIASAMDMTVKIEFVDNESLSEQKAGEIIG